MISFPTPAEFDAFFPRSRPAPTSSPHASRKPPNSSACSDRFQLAWFTRHVALLKLNKNATELDSVAFSCGSGGGFLNPRPLGYEPNELPLLHPATWPPRTSVDHLPSD